MSQKPLKSNLDSGIQTSLGKADNAIPSSQIGVANGVASLDGTGKVPSAQLPSMNYIPTSAEGTANGVATLDSSGNVPTSQLKNVPPSNQLTSPNAWIQ